MRTCSCCEKIKPDIDFPKDPSHKSGLHSWCRLCVNQRQQERRLGIKRPKTYNMVNRSSSNRIVNNQHQRLCCTCKEWKFIEEFHRTSFHSKAGRDYRCRACANALGRSIQRKLKIEVISAYGGKCTCCNETKIDFLTIDHTNNDGNEHRKVISGAYLYRWLRKHNFPKDDFQVLCWNCNMGKANNNGICPHKQV